MATQINPRPSERVSVRYWVITLLLWVAPITAALIIGAGELEQSTLSNSQRSERTGLVGSRMDDGAQAVSITLEWSDDRAVEWPRGLDGVVTSVVTTEGSHFADGAVVASVDGAAVVIQSSGIPLYRDIRAGDRGGDVEWLDRVLQQHLQVPSTLDVEGRATRSTEAAVAALQLALGHRVGGALDRRYVMWADVTGGSAAAEVGAVAARVGSSPSGDFAKMRRHLVGVQILYSVTDANRLTLLEGTPLALEFGGRTLLVRSPRFTPDDLAELESLVNEGDASIDDALVRRELPLEFGSVAASAVVRLLPDRWCLIAPGENGAWTVKRFSPVSSVPIEPGIEYVPIELEGQQYIEEPSESAAAACE